MKKVAFIATNEFDAFAGSELLWMEAARRLAENGQEVFVNVPRWKKIPDRLAALARQPGVRISIRPNMLPLWGKVLAKAGLATAESHFEGYRRAYLRSVRPELAVVSQGGLVDGVGWMAAGIKTGTPFVALVHLVADALWPSAELATEAVSVYPQARRVYFVSNENRASASRQLGVEFSNAAVVRNPYNVPYNASGDWPVEEVEWRLACVGRLGVEHKGQDLLMEVLAADKWRGRKLRVSLYGQGHHKAYLERLKTMRSCDAVSFGGYTHGIAEVWRTHHGAIMPSRYEGLPIALVEAMLCHRMAVVTAVGGNGELVREGETGFVAAAPTVRELDAALERAWAQRDRWREMGEAAAEMVRRTMPSDPVAGFLAELGAAQ